MLTVRVQLPPNPFAHLKAFGRFLPKTISDALNETAFRTRGDLVGSLKDYMTVRSKWTQRGMRVEKSSAETLTARVGNIRPYMRAQTMGGDRPDPGGGKQVIPVQARPRPNLSTRPSNWPGRLTRDRGAFVATIKGVSGVWLRKKRGRRGGKGSVRLMWMFVDQVELKARWPLDDLAKAGVRQHWKDAAVAALERTAQYLRDRASKDASYGGAVTANAAVLRRLQKSQA